MKTEEFELNNSKIESINDMARDYFWNTCNLTYNDITRSTWGKLVDIVEKSISVRNSIEKAKPVNERDYIYKIQSSRLNRLKSFTKSAYIQVKVDNYSVREGISFNTNRWIGFAGWASKYNTELFVNAFIEWCDWVVKSKENNLM